ncbi:MAG TPA: hypothetical protein VGC64_08190, partial [Pyrinomonadaceae bacterium]
APHIPHLMPSVVLIIFVIMLSSGSTAFSNPAPATINLYATGMTPEFERVCRAAGPPLRWQAAITRRAFFAKRQPREKYLFKRLPRRFHNQYIPVLLYYSMAKIQE